MVVSLNHGPSEGKFGQKVSSGTFYFLLYPALHIGLGSATVKN